MKELPHGAIMQPVIKVIAGTVIRAEQSVIDEAPLTVFLNGKELITMLASPGDEDFLIIGFLASEGIIHSIADIKRIDVDTQCGIAHVDTREEQNLAEKMFLKRYLSACCGKGRSSFYFANDVWTARKVENDISVTGANILLYSERLDEMSEMYRLTHGTHSGALAKDGELLCYSQDIGRHNVFDKIYGRCLQEGISVEDKVIVFTGRVSSEIVLKVSKMNIPMIISRSAPTSLALDLADEMGITVVGFAKGEKFNIYTHSRRVSIQNKSDITGDKQYES